MALIKCPECGHDVSTKAYSCPNCGYVLDEKDIDMHKSNDISDNAMDATDDIEVDILQDINIENKDLDITLYPQSEVSAKTVIRERKRRDSGISAAQAR